MHTSGEAKNTPETHALTPPGLCTHLSLVARRICVRETLFPSLVWPSTVSSRRLCPATYRAQPSHSRWLPWIHPKQQHNKHRTLFRRPLSTPEENPQLAIALILKSIEQIGRPFSTHEELAIALILKSTGGKHNYLGGHSQHLKRSIGAKIWEAILNTWRESTAGHSAYFEKHRSLFITSSPKHKGLFMASYNVHSLLLT